ncbi:hypothetical protein CKO11_11190 [Rhodobacter sp. TJ_12]|nr:hypothetical protein [Rhodobacter sp. TJ_12]
MRVRQEVIARVRKSYESPRKSAVRRMVLPYVAWKHAVKELGEGFHWGKDMGIKNARIGRFAYVGPGARFSGTVVVGDLTMISANFAIIGNDHEIASPETPARIAFRTSPRPVTVIESDVWIGRGVMMLEGVRIGRGSVIGAGAVVCHDVPRYSVVGGVPAKLIKPRFDPGGIERAERYLYGADG